MIPRSHLIHGLCQVPLESIKSLICITLSVFWLSPAGATTADLRKFCGVLVTKNGICDSPRHDAVRQRRVKQPEARRQFWPNPLV